jgi:hypothetical protein
VFDPGPLVDPGTVPDPPRVIFAAAPCEPNLEAYGELAEEEVYGLEAELECC